MSTVLVEIFNLGFKTVTIRKDSSGAIIDTIALGQPSKTFSLLANCDNVEITIDPASPEAATVSLEGNEVPSAVSVQGVVGAKQDLYDDKPLPLRLSMSTILVLKPVDPPAVELAGTPRAAMETDSADGVKCGEAIILPAPPS